MKKIWKIMILCMILCFFCAGCSNDDEMISEDHPKPTTEKRTEIIKQKTTQKKNEVTVDQEQSKQQEDRIKIAIDAGHQRKQMSEKEAIGPGSDKTKPMVSSGTEGVVTKRTEYQVNLEVSLKLKSALIARGYDVYMIRETNDVSLSNKKRALMANESGSDILLRIHCNSADSQSANGALTMSPTLSNPYCRSIAADSQELSECVVSTLCRRTGAVNRGVTQTDEMTGINWSKIPVTIVEMGFMSNPEEDYRIIIIRQCLQKELQMVLTDIMREEEKRMKKNEKQIIISLGVAIVVVAIALIAMMIMSGNSDNGQSSSLKDAVQQESNGNGSDDVSESDAGESVSEEDAGESGDNMTTEQPTTQETTTEEVTEEATTAAKNNTASNVMDADDGYIFPDADTSYVSKSSVKKLSDEELQYAVNEVYARHGLKFTKKKNKERFEKKEWYVGTVDDQNDISLNKYEKKNVDTMAAELKKRGLR